MLEKLKKKLGKNEKRNEFKELNQNLLKRIEKEN
jgi:hypothetical protein